MGIELRGKQVADVYEEKILKIIDEKQRKGFRVPSLAVITANTDGGSMWYVSSIQKKCEKLGVICEVHRLSEDTTESELVEVIHKLNDDNSIDGILLQLPVPQHIDESRVMNEISYEKDVDGQSYINMGRLYKGEEAFIPNTALAVVELCRTTGVNLEGKNAVVVGRSNIVGKPAAQLLLAENATVTICHSKTKDLQAVCANADVLISCVGKPKLIDASLVKEGAIVIDVGTTEVEGKIVGDVDFDSAISKAGYVTPVPGGVGRVTTTLLLWNVCMANKNNIVE